MKLFGCLLVDSFEIWQLNAEGLVLNLLKWLDFFCEPTRSVWLTMILIGSGVVCLLL
jgi:hypothetical protein